MSGLQPLLPQPGMRAHLSLVHDHFLRSVVATQDARRQEKVVILAPDGSVKIEALRLNSPVYFSEYVAP